MADIEFKEEDGKEFEKVIEENKDLPTFADFNATWCGPCRALKPQLKKICEDNKFNFISVDVDENPELSEKYGVQGIPYVVVFVKGEKAFEFTGNKPEKINEAIEIAKKN